MIPLDDAQRLVVGSCHPLPARQVPLDEALGCVLADAVVAAEPSPPFANSAMDGYAVLAADTAGAPVVLDVVATLLAGQHRTEPLRSGEAVRIMTGAPVPAGADAVCMVERTQPVDGGARVRVEIPLDPGQFVRPCGDDFGVGDTVFAAGEVLGPAHVGVLTGLGVATVPVHPRPRVGVLSTGDELTEAPGPLRPGQIRDSNRRSLLARLSADGFAPVDLGHVGDDDAALSAALDGAAPRCDAVLTSGGVSVGDRDLVKEVLRARCGESAQWLQVAVKPAKPFAFGVLPTGGSGVPVFGLPGNPVSSLVSYELLARPGLRRLGGHRHPFRATLRAVLDTDHRRPADGKLHLVSALVSVGPDGALHARPGTGQGSHRLRSFATANALALVPDGEGLPAGAAVDVLLLAEPLPAQVAEAPG